MGRSEQCSPGFFHSWVQPLCPNKGTGTLQPERRACQHFVLASTVPSSVMKHCMAPVNDGYGYICHMECNLPYKIKCAGCLHQVRTVYSCVNENAVIERKLCRNKEPVPLPGIEITLHWGELVSFRFSKIYSSLSNIIALPKVFLSLMQTVSLPSILHLITQGLAAHFSIIILKCD